MQLSHLPDESVTRHRSLRSLQALQATRARSIGFLLLTSPAGAASSRAGASKADAWLAVAPFSAMGVATAMASLPGAALGLAAADGHATEAHASELSGIAAAAPWPASLCCGMAE